MLFEPLELIERLVALIPAPRANLLRYHGTLAPGSKLRSRIVPAAGEQQRSEARACSSDGQPAPSRRPRYGWAELMRRVFAIDPLDCPHCGGRLRLLALIERPSIARRILKHLGHRTTPRATAPARAPPQTAWDELGA